MSKRMSKTLAAELAERTLKVVNPANRVMALNESLRRHGFEALRVTELPGDKAALAAWLMKRFAGNPN